MNWLKELVFLIGFSFSGKTEAAKKASQLLGWEAMDIDEEIERRCGKPIARIFAEDGEKYFREMEKMILREACLKERLIISTGGGIVIDEQNRRIMRENGLVILLDASPSTIYQRLLENRKGPLRPLLESEDPLKRIEELKLARKPFYSIAHITIQTDNLKIQDVANKIAHYLKIWMLTPKAEVKTQTSRCPIFIGDGILSGLSIKLHQFGLEGRAVVIGDSTVLSIYKQAIEGSLKDGGFPSLFYAVPSGEASKSLSSAFRIYRFLADNEIERGDIIITVGGGMVGDLGGFVASTYLRGLPLVQIPTTLLAMVDSAIGGKTAINLPRGKNLVGTFYQPKLVLIDIDLLKSLPKRELFSGFAEIIKYGFIGDERLLKILEERAFDLKSLKEDIIAEVISRCVEIKAGIVSQDEREERGLRMILNFGHTIGHGIEAATRYRRFLHGEAVSLGMLAEARLGERIGITPQKVFSRLKKLISEFELPSSSKGIRAEKVIEAIKLDKKRRHGRVRWVLLKEIGKPLLIDDVPLDKVREVIDGITGGWK